VLHHVTYFIVEIIVRLFDLIILLSHPTLPQLIGSRRQLLRMVDVVLRTFAASLHVHSGCDGLPLIKCIKTVITAAFVVSLDFDARLVK
jgi:hypothetical protein